MRARVFRALRRRPRRTALDAGPWREDIGLMAEPLIRAAGLQKHYGTRAALSGVSVEAAAGELVACIGPNGAGKTTLLSVLAGVIGADAGEVLRDGASVGWVPQRPALYGKLSVEDNVRLFA